jgi:hypothetical protein
MWPLEGCMWRSIVTETLAVFRTSLSWQLIILHSKVNATLQKTNYNQSLDIESFIFLLKTAASQRYKLLFPQLTLFCSSDKTSNYLYSGKAVFHVAATTAAIPCACPANVTDDRRNETEINIFVFCTVRFIIKYKPTNCTFPK